MELSSEEIYKKLKDEFIGKECIIKVSFNDMEMNIKCCDIIGNIIQSLVSIWFKKNNINCIDNLYTQTPPDFFNGCERKLLEVKSFNGKKTPAFDISNFYAFCDRVKNDKMVLDTDYLIFEYICSDNGFIIKNIYLKKIWEITGLSKDNCLKVQKKRGKIYAIRPFSFTGKKSFFSCKEDFLLALYKTENKYNKDRIDATV